jgi:hypothetical protein
MGLTRHGHTHLLRPHRRPFHSIHILSWQRVDAPSTRTDKDQLSASHLCLTDCLPLRPASHCHAHAQSEAGHHPTLPNGYNYAVAGILLSRIAYQQFPPPAPAPRTVSLSPPLLRSHHRAPPREGTKEEERGHRRRGFGLRSRRLQPGREPTVRAHWARAGEAAGACLFYLARSAPLRAAPGGCGCGAPADFLLGAMEAGYCNRKKTDGICDGVCDSEVRPPGGGACIFPFHARCLNAFFFRSTRSRLLACGFACLDLLIAPIVSSCYFANRGKVPVVLREISSASHCVCSLNRSRGRHLSSAAGS